MPSGSTTKAIRNGKKPLSSNKDQAGQDKQSLQAGRLGAFMASSTSTVLASDLDPQGIQAAHKTRVSDELKAIMSRIS
ncbi:hypothetical protein F4819DRAFT_454556 [Hypoxylon fuscum]|nr:hypothetical protein F4819DRAFT_454556 [Hypoxylon fuscum]